MNAMMLALKKVNLVNETVEPEIDLELENMNKFNSYVPAKEDIDLFNTFNPMVSTLGKKHLKYTEISESFHANLDGFKYIRIPTYQLFSCLGFKYTANSEGMVVASGYSLITVSKFNELYSKSMLVRPLSLAVVLIDNWSNNNFLEVKIYKDGE